MANYIGIDLGTTNSVICHYDGNNTKIYKSPQEQNDVTPSAIYIDKRTKYVGARAYSQLAQRPNNVAYLFKRFMGSATMIKIPAMNMEMTPIECSAEILRTLYNYLPSEIRDDKDSGVIITIPAAFNQMQRDATLQAARDAGLENVALLQEPVAAIMSVMKKSSDDGKFLVYDLGGGTLDITLAECINHRVHLLKMGGIQMFGGRDFDNLIVKNIVIPWLEANFDLPDFSSDTGKKLLRVAQYATEKAKITLSSQTASKIVANEDEVRISDNSGEEIYFDIPITQTQLNSLIFDMVDKSVEVAKEIIQDAGVTPNDIEKIVFVGGPTNYASLRDRVSTLLSIPACTDVNPMTAVAEGASIYAESIDWGSANRDKKNAKSHISADEKSSISFNFVSRTPDIKAKIATIMNDQTSNVDMIQIDSLETGWTSGKLKIRNCMVINLPLSKMGENTFKIYAFDVAGVPIKIGEDKIVITRTLATVEAIPASYSLGIEALTKARGTSRLVYLVNQGEQLPVKGQKIFRATENLVAGEAKSINFKIWEGEIKNPVSDNRPVGTIKIKGSDFDSGTIFEGTELVCDYEISDSGHIKLNITIPSLHITFKNTQFYTRQTSEMDYAQVYNEIVAEANATLSKIDELSKVISDQRITNASNVLKDTLEGMIEGDNESILQGSENILEAKRLLAKISEEHLSETRQFKLNLAIDSFNKDCRKYAKQSEITAFDNLVASAQHSININTPEFEIIIDDLNRQHFDILWRQDWFVIQTFKLFKSSPGIVFDKAEFNRLVNLGDSYVTNGNIEGLKNVIYNMLRTCGNSNLNFDSSIANIMVG